MYRWQGIQQCYMRQPPFAHLFCPKQVLLSLNPQRIVTICCWTADKSWVERWSECWKETQSLCGFCVAGDHPGQHGPSLPSLFVSETAVKVLGVTQGPVFHGIACIRWWFSEGLVSICCRCWRSAELMRIFVLIVWVHCSTLDSQNAASSWPAVSALVYLSSCSRCCFGVLKDKPADVSEECNREASQGMLTMENASFDVCACFGWCKGLAWWRTEKVKVHEN